MATFEEKLARARRTFFTACGVTEETATNTPVDLADTAETIHDALLFLAIQHEDPDAFLAHFVNGLRHVVNVGKLKDYQRENIQAHLRKQR